MKLEEIEKYIEENSEIDIDLERASRNLPNIQARAINMKLHEQNILKSLMLKLDVLEHDKWMYYSGKKSPEVYKENPFELKVLKTEVDRFIGADADVQEIKARIMLQENKLDALNEFIKTLNQRGYLIRSIIDVQKMQKGLI